MVLYEEKEIDRSVWELHAPDVELDSYLRGRNGPGLNPIGRDVVFVKEGYLEQCRVMRQALVDPCWSSFALRWDCMTNATGRRPGSGAQHSRRLGNMETCQVMEVSYHRRRRAERFQPGEECFDTPLRQGKYFVRLRLQRMTKHGERGSPACVIIDHFVDAGVGEWLVPLERYGAAAATGWSRGDRIRMFWADQAASGVGQWWAGKVLGYVKRGAEDLFRDSLWAAVRIRWSLTGTIDNISPWELSPADSGPRDLSGAESGATLESNDELLEAGNDEEEGQSRSRRRRSWRSRGSSATALGSNREPSGLLHRQQLLPSPGNGRHHNKRRRLRS